MNQGSGEEYPEKSFSGKKRLRFMLQKNFKMAS